MPRPREPKAYVQLHATTTASLPPHKCNPALLQGHGDATAYLEETQGQGLHRAAMGSLCLVAKGLGTLSDLPSFSSAGVAQGTSPT